MSDIAIYTQGYTDRQQLPLTLDLYIRTAREFGAFEHFSTSPICCYHIPVCGYYFLIQFLLPSPMTPSIAVSWDLTSSRPRGEVLYLVIHACRVSSISGTDAEDKSEWTGRPWGPHLRKGVSRVKPWCGPKNWKKAGVRGQLGCHVVHQPNQGFSQLHFIRGRGHSV